jgi:Holliday junction DNA helicase RuvA
MAIRENDVRLYGFLSPQDRALFRLLLTVQGVGPKMALNLLSLGLEALVGAIYAKDVAAIAKAPGVGRKTAERVTAELAEKAAALRELKKLCNPHWPVAAGPGYVTAAQIQSMADAIEAGEVKDNGTT